MSVEARFSAATDTGKERPHNEDNYLVDNTLNLFVVADGMGGHASGELASQMAVEELRGAVEQNADILEKFSRNDPAVTAHDILTLMEHAVQAACAAIYERAQAEPAKRGMGTTSSALLLVGDRGFVAHVGDSRIYLVRHGHVVQLTEDHSLVNELVRRGKIAPDEIDSSPYRDLKNAVTRAVGVYESVQVDTFDFDLLPGDRFLLCSDGLHSYLEDKDLSELLTGTDLDQVSKHLVQVANDGGGHDNITAVVLRIEQTAAPADRSALYARKIEALQRMPFFHDLEMKEIMRVLNVTEVRDYAAGDVILVEGQPGEEMFIILSGKVKLHKAEAHVTQLGAGSCFGELSLIDEQPRSASVTAIEPSRALVLLRKHFLRLVDDQSMLSRRLLWNMLSVITERLRKTTLELAGARLEAEPLDLGDLS